MPPATSSRRTRARRRAQHAREAPVTPRRVDAVEPAEEAAAGPCEPFSTGSSSVAHSAGVSVSATMTDSIIAETMVIENWR